MKLLYREIGTSVENSKDLENISSNSFSSVDVEKVESLTNEELQDYLLQNVSRTFALTIPQLPETLCKVVSNAYLLCRIVDTIEDEPALSCIEKDNYSKLFIKALDQEILPEEFVKELFPKLSSITTQYEKELIQHTPRILEITNSFEQPQQIAVKRCVRIMSEGMINFQKKASIEGLSDLSELDSYCYYVAGVVGEMLTDLFCLHSPSIEKNREKMMELAVSFGQGLQMTNILKDVWKDYQNSRCWLPRSDFKQYGIDLSELSCKKTEIEFQHGLKRLVGIAHGHLKNAMDYTIMIPPQEAGIRKFCLWAIGMAQLTLRKIHKNIDFTDSNEVKISRNSVKATIVITSLFAKRNAVLITLFSLLGRRLPYQKI